MATDTTPEPNGTATVEVDTMRALVRPNYGGIDALQFVDVPKPIPTGNETLVKVKATSVNALDWHLMQGAPYFIRAELGLRGPKTPMMGADFAGVIVEVGPDVEGFEVGDEVFGDSAGSWAEYVVVEEPLLARKPESLSFEEAASLPVAGLTALQCFKNNADLKPGDHVLINGASGGVGTLAIQVAKAMGARVTAVCSTDKVDRAWELGADHVIDYTVDDYVDLGGSYDFIFDLPGNHPARKNKRVMNDGAGYAMIGGSKNRWFGPLPYMALSLLSYKFSDKSMRFFVAKSDGADVSELAAMADSGQIKAVIQDVYRLDDAIEAMRAFDGFHSWGKHIITMSD